MSNSNSNSSSFEKLIDYSRRLEELCDINLMLQAYKQLIAKLESCKTNSDKFMSISSMARQLDAN